MLNGQNKELFLERKRKQLQKKPIFEKRKDGHKHSQTQANHLHNEYWSR